MNVGECCSDCSQVILGTLLITEKAMRDHPDYKHAMQECDRASDEDKKTMIKFEAIVVNRILYHLIHHE